MSKKQALFLDCGGHVGESIMHFKKTDLYKEYDWHIDTFEPLEELADKMLCVDDDDVELHRAAVWIENGSIDFYTTDGRSDYYGVEDVPWGSSTVMKEKTSGNINPDRKITVPSINLAEFIEDKKGQFDLIILKMDIEGAEYDILEHLFETGAITAIDALMIEYHYKKVGVSLWRHLKLKMKLRSLNIPIIEERKGHLSGSWFDNLETVAFHQKGEAA